MVPAVTRRKTRLGRVVIAAAMAAALLFGLFRMALHHAVARHLQATVQLIPGCTGIRYDKLRIPYFGLQGQLHDATLLFARPDDDIPVARIHIRRLQPGTRLPRALDAAVQGFSLRTDHPLLGPLRSDLQALGYASLTGDVEMRWVRQGETRESWDLDLVLRVASAGELTVSIRLDKVNPEGVALALENPFNWFVVLPAVELVKAGASFKDLGLAERALTAAAHARGQRPEDFREALSRNLAMRAQQAGEPAEQAFWHALATFGRHPGSVGFGTRLPRPLPLGRLVWMRTPGDVVRGLALESRTGE